MGKNYIENSLKRFLKRKVKITLGLIVAFMITGTVGFAETNTELKQEEHKNHWEWEQVKEAQKYLTNDKVNLNNVEENGGTDDRHFRKESGKNSYKIKIDERDITFGIAPQNLTDITKANLNNSFILFDNLLNKNRFEKIEGLGEEYNNALDLTHTAQSIYIAENGEVAIIDTDIKEEVTVQTANNGIIINKGILSKGQNGSNNSEIYNFGLLNFTQKVGNSVGYNYGIINTVQDNGQTGTGNGIVYNYGLIDIGGSAGQQVEAETYNYGIITTSKNMVVGQSLIKDNAKAYNYNLIKINGSSQNTAKNNTELYNYGNIDFTSAYSISTNSTYLGGAQLIYGGTKNKGYNYGIINNYANRNNTLGAGQYIRATGDNRMYNFGIINSNAIAQYIYTSTQGEESSIIYNYGTLNVTKDTNNADAIEKGQYIKGYISGDNSIATNNKGYNYGTIDIATDSDGVGQYLEKSGEIYNFGIINNNGSGYAMQTESVVDGHYKAKNYGVINAGNDGKAFSGNIENKGFVITKDGNTDTKWTGENHGVILKEDLTLAQTNKNDNVVDLSGETGKIALTDTDIKVDGTTVSSSPDKITAFMKNQTATLTGERYNSKNILAVTDNNWNGGNIIEANLGSETTLDLVNTVITGYFTGEKGGTVLAVDSDLTLIGDTVISAIKGENVTDEVYALSLKDGTMLTFVGESTQINGKINGKEAGITNVAAKELNSTGELGVLRLRNANQDMIDNSEITEETNYTDVTLGQSDELTLGKLELSFRGTTADKTNKVHLTENVKVTGDIDGSYTKHGTGEGYEDNKIELTLDKISNVGGDIILGEYDDIIKINKNEEYKGTIDGNLGNDTLIVSSDTARATVTNELNYNIKDVENIELGTGNWKFGNGLDISTDNADKTVTLKTEGTLVSEIGSDYKGSLKNNGNADIVVDKGTVKYSMGSGFAVKDSITLDDVTIGENGKAESVVIYNANKNNDGTTTLTLKSAADIGITNGKDAKIYEALLNGIAGNDDLRTDFNEYKSEQDVLNRVSNTKSSVKAYYTSGYVVTKNIADTYSSIAENLDKRAGKGEWLAQGKYINSDTEFDGGVKVKGYDGNITGTVGMIEYGVSEQKSYGAVFGKGKTEVDIDGGGDLEGDNYYIGGFVKYRTLGGVDLVGNIGIAKSDLDSNLSDEITVHNDNSLGSIRKYYEGTADSKAITLSLIGKKDFYITDNVRLQPKMGARYNFIQQDEAVNEGMGFRIAAQDVTIIEGLAGMGIAKDIELNSGRLSLNAGLEYTLSNASQYDEMEYTLEGTKLDLESSEMADNRGLVYFGADYEHENGVGFNGKYEMIWSDTGDDSRITAGVSYKF